MVEPTIYKPSIYNGAGVYNNGAGGGGGGGAISLNTKRIIPVNDNSVCPPYVDENGYIGGYLPQYEFKHFGAFEQSAVIISGADFSGSGLGQVTFLDYETIGDKSYPTMTRNGIKFMAENLDYKFTGLNVGHGAGALGLFFGFYYDNDESKFGYNGAKYGLLYSVDACQKIDELFYDTGWHVPSISEINTFFNDTKTKYLFPRQYNISTLLANSVGEIGFGLPMSGYENGNGGNESFGGLGNYWYTYTNDYATKMWYNVNYQGNAGTATNGWRAYSLRLCKND